MRVLISAFYFFSLLCSYYVLRPIRDELGIRYGIERLPWLFTGTFVAMLLVVPLFGWLASRLPARDLLPAIYVFFLLNLFFFYVTLERGGPRIAAAFFIWLSVFNLCVVSVFWSFMADVFRTEDAKKKFGRIAAGGMAGAIAGPAIASVFEQRTSILIAAAFLMIAIACVRLLAEESKIQNPKSKIDVLAGIRITLRSPLLLGVASIIVCYTTLSTILYFQQAKLISAATSHAGERTAWFASIDLCVNAISILLQLFGTGALVERIGVGATLAIVPMLLSVGFAALGIAPKLAVLAVVQIIHRSANFGLTRPAREMLFTNVDGPTKYQAKNFVDTTVYRASDALSAWLAPVASVWIAIPITVIWMITAFSLGRRHDARI